MFKPGDVVSFHSNVAGKRKFHLCVSLADHFLFLNSPKASTYPGDLVIDCSELPFIPATPSGKSIVSCSLVLAFSAADLRRANATKIGEASRELMIRILEEVEDSSLLSEADREAILSGLGDYF